jgi:hypothetical protein
VCARAAWRVARVSCTAACMNALWSETSDSEFERRNSSAVTSRSRECSSSSYRASAAARAGRRRKGTAKTATPTASSGSSRVSAITTGKGGDWGPVTSNSRASNSRAGTPSRNQPAQRGACLSTCPRAARRSVRVPRSTRRSRSRRTSATEASGEGTVEDERAMECGAQLSSSFKVSDGMPVFRRASASVISLRKSGVTGAPGTAKAAL